MEITKEIWKEICDILLKYTIPYTSRWESRDIPRAMEYPDITVQDKHVQINLVIPDYFEEEQR